MHHKKNSKSGNIKCKINLKENVLKVKKIKSNR